MLNWKITLALTLSKPPPCKSRCAAKVVTTATKENRTAQIPLKLDNKRYLYTEHSYHYRSNWRAMSLVFPGAEPQSVAEALFVLEAGVERYMRVFDVPLSDEEALEIANGLRLNTSLQRLW